MPSKVTLLGILPFIRKVYILLMTQSGQQLSAAASINKWRF